MLRIFLWGVLLFLVAYDFAYQDYFSPPPTRTPQQLKALEQTNLNITQIDLQSPEIIDGDGFFIKNKEIRLHGIDAPELSQTCTKPDGKKWDCGEQSKQVLANLLRGKKVSCRVRTVDTFKRLIATCDITHNNRTVEVNKYMVAKGWAFAYTQYSKKYVRDEITAKRAKIGIWNGKCLPPWQWRRLSNV